MRIRHRLFSCICMLALCPVLTVSAMAESEPFGFGEGLDEEMLLFADIPSVYSASKYEQKVTEAPSRVSIVTAEEIQRYGYQTLADILRSLPGFYTTYDRNYDYIGVRGFGIPGDYDTRLLLLVDGHRINDNVYDSLYSDRGFILDVDLIDRVELVRGPSSSLYGSSAFFGVVNVITKKGRDLNGAEISAAAGSHDSYQGRVSYGKRFDNGLEMLISGTYYDSEGRRLYYSEFDDPATNNGVAEDADDAEAESLFARLSFGDFTLDGAYCESKKGVPTASYGAVFNDPRTRTWDGRWYLDLKYQHLMESGTEVTARLFYDRIWYYGEWAWDYAEEEGDPPDIEIFKDDSDGKWWGAEALVTRELFERHRFILGAEFRDSLQQEQGVWDIYEVYLDTKTDDYTWAIYMQDEFRIRDDLILNLGLRYDYFDTVGSNANPRAAMIYSPFESTTLKLLYGTAFRAPNTYELYYHDGGYTQKPSEDLDSETIETFELVLEQRLTEHLRAVASVFRNEIEDLIAMTTDPADDLLVFENMGDAKATGTELELEGQWDNGWKGSLSYTYQDAENDSTGKRLVNFSRQMVKLNLIAPLIGDDFGTGLEMQYESGRKTIEGNETDDTFITNLTLFSKNWIKGLRLSASIYNLFDEDYGYPASEEHSQDIIEQDGRTFRFKLDYAF